MRGSDKYTIKEVKNGWQVIHPLGYVCNDFTHKTYEDAKKYWKILEAFRKVYGGNNG